MLTFFRKIRKSLVDSSSARKYILYAIGEIALVVIGILIALQINNWNEWRKDREQETFILNQIKENIEENINANKGIAENLRTYNRSSEIIIRSLENKLPYHDSLTFHFHISRLPGFKPRIVKTGYEALKNAGFEIVSNPTVLESILTLFESLYSIINGIAQDTEIDNPTFENFIVNNFELMNGRDLIPHDYNQLCDNHFYRSWLKTIRDRRNTRILTHESLNFSNQKVLQLIKEELGEE